ncbi:MAG: hypothetical protein ACLPM3_00535 [Terracidiphilus sp.]
MKRLTWVLVLLLTAAPAWAANKMITVQQLKDLLVSWQQNQLSDNEAAGQLKELDLSEELSESAASSLGSYLSGPLSVEQIEIMKAKSAFLAPPPSDLPASPAPDAPAQKTILAKTAEYATRIYMQNPHLSVIKTTLRFEDETRVTNTVSIATLELLHYPMHLVSKSVDPVETDKGVEKAAASVKKTKWGENCQISEGEPGPNLGAVFQEASSSGKIDWLRWEMIEGRQIAVFSFSVEKKKSHFNVNHCCFPNVDTVDHIAGHLVPGEIQPLTTWVPFKKTVGYHGEFFISPDTGAIVRIITQAEMKPSDNVIGEDKRTDYGPVVVDGKEYMLPRVSYTVVEAVPNANSSSVACITRFTLLHTTYQAYKLAGTN